MSTSGAVPPGVSWNSNLSPSDGDVYTGSEMTDSVEIQSSPSTVARPGKRERLVGAAADLLYRQGVEKTTLADIADAADVPLGNVYYYFKTKDAIVDAVVEAHVQHIEEMTASIDRRYRSPKGRLKGLIRMLTDQRDVIAQIRLPGRHALLGTGEEKRRRRPRCQPPCGDSYQLGREAVPCNGSKRCPGSRCRVHGQLSRHGCTHPSAQTTRSPIQRRSSPRALDRLTPDD